MDIIGFNWREEKNDQGLLFLFSYCALVLYLYNFLDGYIVSEVCLK